MTIKVTCAVIALLLAGCISHPTQPPQFVTASFNGLEAFSGFYSNRSTDSEITNTGALGLYGLVDLYSEHDKETDTVRVATHADSLVFEALKGGRVIALKELKKGRDYEIRPDGLSLKANPHHDGYESKEGIPSYSHEVSEKLLGIGQKGEIVITWRGTNLALVLLVIPAKSDFLYQAAFRKLKELPNHPPPPTSPSRGGSS